MAFKIADRVRETNAVTGTGNVTLGGTVAGFNTFSSQMTNGDTTWYAIVDNTANTWEVGVGTFNTGPTLSRTTVLASSNAGSLVNFAGNACDMFMDIPAAVVRQAASALNGTAIVANATLGTVPANATLLYAIIRETAGHAVAVSLGSTSGASDVLAAVTVGAGQSLLVPAGALSLNWFSATVAQAVFVTSAAWASASLNITLVYQVGP